MKTLLPVPPCNSSAKTQSRSSSTKKRHQEACEGEDEEGSSRSDAKTPTSTGEKKAKGTGNKIRRLEEPLKLTKAQSDMLAKEKARSDAVDNFPLIIEKNSGPAASRPLCDFF
jgi:hypothetical protein